MQLALHFDQTRCTGCYACVVACKDWQTEAVAFFTNPPLAPFGKGGLLVALNVIIRLDHRSSPAVGG